MDDNKNLYKYMGPDIVDKFLMADNKCSLKLSYLKDYNDPFEFFLTIDYNQEPEILAYYKEIISMVTESPVTCFSKSPLITPMWAHYASNSQGFVVEINEGKLQKWLEEEEAAESFGDIDYQDTPHDYMQDMLQRAYVLCKPRHVGFLWQAVTSAAYFTKQNCWSYEQERRLITNSKISKKINDTLSLLYFPADFVSSIVVGAKSSAETKIILREVSEKIGCKYYEKRIGRSSTRPYLVDIESNTYTFNGSDIVLHTDRCASCLEPKSNAQSTLCAWCCITEKHEEDAGHRNSFRMLEHAGILDSYIKTFLEVGRKQ
ncbi:hypothetical protein CCL16_14610 [Pseudomonas syringae]|uniref:DUF2971 domain-containing protein n=1 Tax=Pseudomonas TaxID=286 RepID=UPI000BB61663|nr:MULTISPECIES: DUF2971 domain-containing protein [Pseudomonas]PBP86332.1 hypothetical protein CCL16_14610 [Pseudomonas syringae]